MANQRATTISLKDVGAAADKALKLAADKHRVQFDNPTHQFVPDWQTLGGILQALTDMKQVQGVAQEITNSLNQVSSGAGVHEANAAGAQTSALSTQNFQPVVIWTPNHIICGARPAPQIVFH